MSTFEPIVQFILVMMVVVVVVVVGVVMVVVVVRIAWCPTGVVMPFLMWVKVKGQL